MTLYQLTEEGLLQASVGIIKGTRFQLNFNQLPSNDHHPNISMGATCSIHNEARDNGVRSTPLSHHQSEHNLSVELPSVQDFQNTSDRNKISRFLLVRMFCHATPEI